MMSCIYPKCPELANVGDFCIKHFKADHDRRRAVREDKREEKMGKKESNPGPPIGAVKPPPPPRPPAPQIEVKVCKRCKKDKSEDKNFSRKKQLCHSCMVTIRKCEKEGRPVPEYKGYGGRVAGTKNKKARVVNLEVKNPLGPVAFGEEQQEKVQGLIDEAYKKAYGLARKKYDTASTAEVPEDKDKSWTPHRGVVPLPMTTVTLFTPSTHISVDFTDYPTLKTRLEELARQDFRPPEMQILAILDEFLDYAGKGV